MTKNCNKHSMKVNLLVKFNREKKVSKNITLTTNLIFIKVKIWDKSSTKNITLNTNLIFTKLKIWHRSSTNTHLKVFLGF